MADKWLTFDCCGTVADWNTCMGDEWVTAEEVHSYKPDLGHFRRFAESMRRLPEAVSDVSAIPIRDDVSAIPIRD